MAASGIMDKIKYELSVYSSFQAVINKSERDGSLQLMINMLGNIVRGEIDYAIKGNLIRTWKA